VIVLAAGQGYQLDGLNKCLIKDPTDGRGILDAAMRAFSGFHTRPVLLPRGEEIVLADPRLILYYQNRLVAHGLALEAASRPRSRSRTS